MDLGAGIIILIFKDMECWMGSSAVFDTDPVTDGKLWYVSMEICGQMQYKSRFLALVS